MSAGTINEQLKQVYNEYLTDTYSQQWEKEVSAPLLMHVFDEYVDMPVKIMVVGQETYGWAGLISQKPSVDSLLETYKNFELGKKAYHSNTQSLKYLKSPFWNVSRSIFRRLNEAKENVSNRTNGFLWTNISKFDYATGTPTQDLQNRNYKGFALLRDEILIAKPDVVVFLTGTKYDDKIEAVLGFKPQRLDASIPVIRLHKNDASLPNLIFKTEHPRTLYQHKMYRGKKTHNTVIDWIVKEVTK